MRALQFDAIEARKDGDFERLPAGPYVARVVSMEDKPSKEYVELVWDVAEGEKAGFYSDDWGKSHPYAHHVFLSYKDTALGMLKGRLQCITESNPGFDSEAAWNGGRLDMFTNRLFGINVQEEEYEHDGKVKVRLNVCQVVTAQDVRDGKVQKRDIKRLDGASATTAAPAPAPQDDVSDVPFM